MALGGIIKQRVIPRHQDKIMLPGRGHHHAIRGIAVQFPGQKRRFQQYIGTQVADGYPRPGAQTFEPTLRR